MKIDEYCLLAEDEKWEELWKNGNHLKNLKTIDCSFSLYALHKFFVEVELCPIKNKIIGKIVFKHGANVAFPKNRLLKIYFGRI